MFGQGRETKRLFVVALSEQPGVYFAPLMRLRASANAHLGRTHAATKYLAELNAKTPGQTVRKVRAALGFHPTRETERYLVGLRLAGMPE